MESQESFAKNLGIRIGNTLRQINSDQIELNKICDQINELNIQVESEMNESNGNMQLILSFSSLLRASRDRLSQSEKDLAELRKPEYNVKAESIEKFDKNLQILKRKFPHIEGRIPASLIGFVSSSAATASYTPNFTEHAEGKNKTTAQMLDIADRKEKEKAEIIDELGRVVDIQHASAVRLEETITKSIEKIDDVSRVVAVADDHVSQAIIEVNNTTKMVKKDAACIWIWVDIAMYSLFVVFVILNCTVVDKDKKKK